MDDVDSDGDTVVFTTRDSIVAIVANVSGGSEVEAYLMMGILARVSNRASNKVISIVSIETCALIG